MSVEAFKNEVYDRISRGLTEYKKCGGCESERFAFLKNDIAGTEYSLDAWVTGTSSIENLDLLCEKIRTQLEPHVAQFGMVRRGFDADNSLRIRVVSCAISSEVIDRMAAEDKRANAAKATRGDGAMFAMRWICRSCVIPACVVMVAALVSVSTWSAIVNSDGTMVSVIRQIGL